MSIKVLAFRQESYMQTFLVIKCFIPAASSFQEIKDECFPELYNTLNSFKYDGS